MIRTVKVTSPANIGKVKGVKYFLVTYNQCVNYFIKRLWSEKIMEGKFINSRFVKPAKKFGLTSRLTQCAGKQALEIIKSQRKSNGKRIPRLRMLTSTLDGRFWRITGVRNNYEWIKFHSGFNFFLPFNKTKMWNKWIDNGFEMSKTIALSIKKERLEIIFFFEKKSVELKTMTSVEGLDLGYRNLVVCSDGQVVGGRIDEFIKKFHKREKHTYSQTRQKTFQELKKLDLSNISTLVVENLKYVRLGTRGMFSRSHNRRMSHWLYAKVREWLKQRCEEQGIRLEFKSPFATSQYCRFCGKWDRRNRSGDRFHCIHCGHEDHADSNASQNLKLLGLAEVYSLRSLTISR